MQPRFKLSQVPEESETPETNTDTAGSAKFRVQGLLHHPNASTMRETPLTIGTVELLRNDFLGPFDVRLARLAQDVKQIGQGGSSAVFQVSNVHREFSDFD